MRGGVVTILFIFCMIFVISVISAASIDEELHLNIQVINSSGGVEAGTFDFEFNISTLADCSDVVYTNFTNLTTDSRGIISYYLENVNLNFSSQYWLCYYRDDVLINSSKIARTPYSFIAKNVSAEGVINDSNMNLVGHNITASSGLFSWLGSLLNRITTLFVQNIDFSGMINGSGNINTTGNMTASYFFGDGSELTGISSYNATYALYNQTFNATYSSYATNVSLNYSKIVFDTWDVRWNTGATTLWDATFNASFDQRNLLTNYTDISYNTWGENWYNHTLAAFNTWDDEWSSTYNATYALYNQTYNATYASYATNVSLNYSKIVFDTWDARWNTGATTLWDATFNASFDQRDQDTITTIWDATFNASFASLDTDTSYNATYALYNQTYNATYASYATNVSLNYSKIVFDTWNTVWSAAGVTLWDATFNASFASLDSDTITTIWDATFNASFASLDTDTSYNATYEAINTTANIQALINGTNMNFADVDFNNGWTSGGVSVIGGDIYAQTLYIYNLSALELTTLRINGSIIPMIGFDDTFDIGNSSLRWKDLWLSGEIYSNGTGDNYFLGSVGIGTVTPTQKLDVRGAINASGTIYINNATDISTWATNVSLNYSKIVFDTWDARWNTGATTLWDADFNASFDQRNLLTNYTSMVFDTWNATWDNNWVNVWAYNHTLDTYTNWNTEWSTTYNATYEAINTTANIQGLLNSTGIYSTYNATYDSLIFNVSYGDAFVNESGDTMTGNLILDEGAGDSPSLIFTDGGDEYVQLFKDEDASFYARLYGDNGNAFNLQLYDADAVGSDNDYSHLTFGLEDDGGNMFQGAEIRWKFTDASDGAEDMEMSFWTSEDGGMSNRMTITSSGQTDVLGALNTTGTIWLKNSTDISTWVTNVSLNYSKIVFDTWDSRWNTGATTLWDAAFNASFDQRDQDTITTIWDATFNASFASLDSSYNATYALYNQTYNATYDAYALNVSLNYSEIVFDTWDARWDDGVTIWDAAFNASFASLDSDTSYNATYANYALNVSLNYSQIVFDTWNTVWSAGTLWDATFNASYLDRGLKAGFNQTFNATYASFTTNVSLNYSEIVFDTWDARWDDGVTIWDAAFNASFASLDSDTSYNATYANYALNVSLNYSQIVFDTWDSKWLNKSGDVMTGNLTLGQKLTFKLGEIIDNIVNGWITITGNLNVTKNMTVAGNITTEDTMCFNSDCSAKIYYNGSGLIIKS